MSRERILLVADRAREVLADALREAGHDVTTATGREARVRCRELDPALLVIELPLEQSLELLRALDADAALDDRTAVVVSDDGAGAVVAAIALGADAVVRRSASLDELLAHVRAGLRNRRRIAELRAERRDQEWLLDLSRTLASQLEVREILFTVASHLAEMVRVDRVSFVIVSRDLEHGYVLAASEDRGAHNIRVSLRNYPEIVEVVQKRQALVVPDVASDPLFADPMKEAIARTEMRSLMLFPLLYGEEVLGVLFLRARTRREELTDREQHLCRIVATATATALRNAQIVQTIRGETQRFKLARLKAERKVRLLRRYEEFCEQASDGMAAVDNDGKVLFLNPSGENLLGCRRAEVVGRPLGEILRVRDSGDEELFHNGLAASVPMRPFDLDVTGRHGEPRTLSVAVSALFGEHGAAVLSFRDVTEDRAMEHDLRETKEFLEGLVRQSPDAIVAASADGEILLWNGAAEQLFGHTAAEAMGGLELERLFPSGELKDILRLLHAPENRGRGRVFPVLREVIARDASRIPVRMSTALLHEGDARSPIFAIFSDVRPEQEMKVRLERTEEQLAEKEKQAVLAELAGSAAHELNQPLTSLLGLGERLRRAIDPEGEARPILEGLVREAERIAEIVRKLGRVTRYETKDYVGDLKIVDLDRSSKDG